jgi:Peptidase C39 family
MGWETRGGALESVSGGLRFTRFAVVLAVLMVGCSAGFLALRRNSEPASIASCSLPISSELTTGVLIYKQWDVRWADDVMAPSTATMRNYGCLVCCVAMLYTHYGIETTPKQLNSYLSTNSGFTRRGLLKWQQCVAYTRGQARIEFMGDGDQRRMDRELAAGNPVIVKVRLTSGIYHWVLVLGGKDREYMVADPLGSEKRTIKLSRFGDRIYAMRIFRKVGG